MSYVKHASKVFNSYLGILPSYARPQQQQQRTFFINIPVALFNVDSSLFSAGNMMADAPAELTSK